MSNLDKAAKKAQEVYTYLRYISIGNEQSEILKSALELATREAPYPETENHLDDLYHWSSGTHRISYDSPLTAKCILALNLEEDDSLETILNLKGNDNFGRISREGVLIVLAEAIQMDSSWGLRLANKLIKEKKFNADVWERIFQGWQSASIDNEQWETILRFLKQNLALLDLSICAQALVYLIESTLKKEATSNEEVEDCENTLEKKESPTSESIFILEEEVLELLWDNLPSSEQDNKHSNDWLLEAINNIAGKIVELWVRILLKRYYLQDIKWQKFPKVYDLYFQKVLNGSTYNAQMGRVILASRANVFYSLFPKWTGIKILPLFSWNVDIRNATQAWHGFLGFGNILNASFRKEMLPYFKDCFDKIKLQLADCSGRFIEYYIELVLWEILYSNIELKDLNIYKMIGFLNSQEREHWGSHIGFQLMHMTENQKITVWTKWLKQYWQDRIGHLIQDGETATMLEWSLYLEPVIDEVSELICQSPPYFNRHSSFFYTILDNKLEQRYPKAILRILQHVIIPGNQINLGYNIIEVEQIIESTLQNNSLSIPEKKDQRQVSIQLINLGSTKAINFLGELEETD